MRSTVAALAGLALLGWLIVVNNQPTPPPALIFQLLLLVGGVTLFTVGVGGSGGAGGQQLLAAFHLFGRRIGLAHLSDGLDTSSPYASPHDILRRGLASQTRIHAEPGRLNLEMRPLLVGGLTLLALTLRVWGAGETIHLFVDELNFVEGVNAVRRGGDLYLLHRFDWVAAFPYVFPVLQSLGVDFVGNTLGGLRLFSAVCGALTVPAVYLLARALTGNHAVPLIAAALLATFPPHLQFSRLALINIVDPLLGTLALACLAQGVNNQHRLTFAAAGALLGMTQYFYEGGRLLYPMLIGLWLGVLLLRRRVRPVAAGVLLLTFGAAALPFYATMALQGYSFFPRLGAKGFDDSYWAGLLTGSASDLAAHLGHIAGTFGVYTFIPDASFYYGGDFPLILPLLAPFFLVGVVVSLWRGAWVLPLTLVGASLGSSLLTTGAWASSLVLTFPVLVILTAWGLVTVLDGLGRVRLRRDLQDAQGRRGVYGEDGGRGLYGEDGGRGIPQGGFAQPRPYKVAIAAIISMMMLAQTVYYFGFHLDGFNRQTRLWTDYQDAVFRSLTFPAGTQVHIVGNHEFYDWDIARMLEFLGRPDLDIHVRQHRTIWAFDAAYLDSLPRSVDHAFYLEAADTPSLDLLRDRFDLLPPQTSPYRVPPDLQFVLHYAPARLNN